MAFPLKHRVTMVNGTKDPLRWSKHANIVKTPMSVQNSRLADRFVPEQLGGGIALKTLASEELECSSLLTDGAPGRVGGFSGTGVVTC